MKKMFGPWVLICFMQGLMVYPACAASNKTIDNWLNGTLELNWKSRGAELCWRDGHWTPATASAGCDGALALVPVACASGTPNLNRDPKTGKPRVLGNTRKARSAALSGSSPGNAPGAASRAGGGLAQASAVGKPGGLVSLAANAVPGKGSESFLMAVKPAPTRVPTSAVRVTPVGGKQLLQPTGSNFIVEKVLPSDPYLFSQASPFSKTASTIEAVVVSTPPPQAKPALLQQKPLALPAPSPAEMPAPVQAKTTTRTTVMTPAAREVASSATTLAKVPPAAAMVPPSPASSPSSVFMAEPPIPSSVGNNQPPPVVLDPVGYCGDRPFQRYGSSVTCL